MPCESTPSSAPRNRRRAPGLTPEQRALRARAAAHAMHAKHDSARIAAKGSAAFLAQFERQVDPDSKLSPQERGRRARHALTAHMTRLALASARARAARKAGEWAS